MRALLQNDWTSFAAALIAAILTAIFRFAHLNSTLTFLFSAISLAVLALVVGQATEQLGNFLGPGATGIIQASIASMPELFVSFFALQAGLVTVVQSALVGSILANSLLVMGLAFLLGGLKNGTQRFGSERPRSIVILMLLAVSALVVPTITAAIHTPAEAHEETLSIASALVLLIVYFASIPFSLQSGGIGENIPAAEYDEERWSLTRVLFVLVAAGIGAAFVSDWFVEALEPTMESLHISQAFAGLVIVAMLGMQWRISLESSWPSKIKQIMRSVSS